MLRNANQEHILLRNEQRKFELVPYDQIKILPKEVRAFIFERKRDLYVIYWNIAENKRLKLPVRSKDITLFEELDQQISLSEPEEDSVILPVSRRRYLRADKLTRKQLIAAFQNAVIIG